MKINYTKEEAWEKFDQLPKELKEVLLSEKTAESIMNTCKKNNLKEISSVAEIVGSVLLGLSPLENFGKNIQELEKDEKRSQKIINELENLIFNPIKSLLLGQNKKSEILTENQKNKYDESDSYREPTK